MWDHEPDADALLDARVQAGWKPTPTGTVHGDLILGHACTRFGNCPPDGVLIDGCSA